MGKSKDELLAETRRYSNLALNLTLASDAEIEQQLMDLNTLVQARLDESAKILAQRNRDNYTVLLNKEYLRILFNVAKVEQMPPKLANLKKNVFDQVDAINSKNADAKRKKDKYIELRNGLMAPLNMTTDEIKKEITYEDVRQALALNKETPVDVVEDKPAEGDYIDPSEDIEFNGQDSININDVEWGDGEGDDINSDPLGTEGYTDDSEGDPEEDPEMQAAAEAIAQQFNEGYEGDGEEPAAYNDAQVDEEQAAAEAEAEAKYQKDLKEGDISGKADKFTESTPDSPENNPVCRDRVNDTIENILRIYEIMYKGLFTDPPVGILYSDKNTGYPRLMCAGKSGEKTGVRVDPIPRYDGYIPVIQNAINSVFPDLREAPPIGENCMNVDTSWMNRDGTMKYNYAPHIQVRNCVGIYRNKEDGRLYRAKTFKEFANKIRDDLKSTFFEFLKRVNFKDINTMNKALTSIQELYTTVVLFNEFKKDRAIRYTIYNMQLAKSGVGLKIAQAIVDADPLMKGDTNGYKIMSSAYKADPDDEKALTSVIEALIVTNETKYRGAINFAYKQLGKLLLSGGQVSLDKTIVGTDLSGAPVTLNLNKNSYTSIGIVAGSRSGKGVLTLSLLASMIAANCPVIYLDYKPDMAGAFWQLERKYDVRMLAIDGKLNTIDGKLTPVRNYRAGYGVPKTLQEDVGSLLSTLPYAKGVQLMELIGSARVNGMLPKDRKAFFVLDEAQECSKVLQDVTNGIVKLRDKAKPKGKASPSDEYKYLIKLAKVFESLERCATSFMNTSAGSGNMSALVLGQQANAQEWKGPLAPLVLKCAVKFLGTNTIGGSKYGMSKATKGADMIGTGYFGLAESNQPDETNTTVIKTTMVLNDADFNPSNPTESKYAGALIKNLNNNPEVKETVIHDDMIVNEDNEIAISAGCEVGKPNPLIGLPGLIEFIGKVSGEGFDVRTSLGSGYRLAAEVLGMLGIVGEGCPYKNVEAYLYSAKSDALFSYAQLSSALTSHMTIYNFLENGGSDDDNDGLISDETSGSEAGSSESEGHVIGFAGGADNVDGEQGGIKGVDPSLTPGAAAAGASTTSSTATPNQNTSRPANFGDGSVVGNIKDTDMLTGTRINNQQAPVQNNQTGLGGFVDRLFNEQQPIQNQQQQVQNQPQQTQNYGQPVQNQGQPVQMQNQSQVMSQGQYGNVQRQQQVQPQPSPYVFTPTALNKKFSLMKTKNLSDALASGQLSEEDAKLYSMYLLNSIHEDGMTLKRGGNAFNSKGLERTSMILSNLAVLANAGIIDKETVERELSKYKRGSMPPMQAAMTSKLFSSYADGKLVHDNIPSNDLLSKLAFQCSSEPSVNSAMVGQYEQTQAPVQPMQSNQADYADNSQMSNGYQATQPSQPDANQDYNYNQSQMQQPQMQQPNYEMQRQMMMAAQSVETMEPEQTPCYRLDSNFNMMLVNPRDTSDIVNISDSVVRPTNSNILARLFKGNNINNLGKAQRTSDKIWESILDAAQFRVRDLSLVKVVRVESKQIVLGSSNRPVVIPLTCLDDLDNGLSLMEIANIHRLMYRFPYITKLSLYPEASEAFYCEYGTDPQSIWKIFVDNPQLQVLALCDVNGDIHPYSREAFKRNAAQTASALKEQAESTRSLGALDSIIASKKDDWSTDTNSIYILSKRLKESAGSSMDYSASQLLDPQSEKRFRTFAKGSASAGFALAVGWALGIPHNIKVSRARSKAKREWMKKFPNNK